MADYTSAFTGAEIDSNLAKASIAAPRALTVHESGESITVTTEDVASDSVGDHQVKTATETPVDTTIDYHEFKSIVQDGYTGGALGNDPNFWAQRRIGGQGGHFSVTTRVNRIDFIWTWSDAVAVTAPEGASLQFSHIRSTDGGTTYKLVKHIGEFENQPDTRGISRVYVDVVLEPTDLIIVRGIGRQMRRVGNTVILPPDGTLESARFGNTSSTDIDAVFPDMDTEVTVSAVGEGLGPAMNIYGTPISAEKKDAPLGTPSLTSEGLLRQMPNPFLEGLTGKKLLVCGTSITTGAGARSQGGLGWADYIARDLPMEVVNEAQGSSMIAMPRKGRNSGVLRPAAIYNVEAITNATTNTIQFTSHTLAQLGINAASQLIGFFSTSDLATGLTDYASLDVNYTIQSLDDANTITVDNVAETQTIITDFATDRTTAGVIEAPTSVDLASLSLTMDEAARLNELGGSFGYFDSGYESKILPHNPDFVIIDHMINDEEVNIDVIGDITSRRRSSYMGAYNFIVDRIYEQNPYARIMFMTNFSSHRGNNPGPEAHMTNQRTKLIELGQARNIPVIDPFYTMGAEPGVNWSSQDEAISGRGLVYDRVHPEVVLHRRLYKLVLSELLKTAY